MSARKFFVGGNWKMNNLRADNEKLIELLNGAKINFETTGWPWPLFTEFFGQFEDKLEKFRRFRGSLRATSSLLELCASKAEPELPCGCSKLLQG